MITKQELISKNEKMNKELLEKDDEIQQLKFQIDNLKSILKSKRGIDMDMVHNTRLENERLKSVNQSLELHLNFLKETYEKDMNKIKGELNFYKDKFETRNIS